MKRDLIVDGSDGSLFLTTDSPDEVNVILHLTDANEKYVEVKFNCDQHLKQIGDWFIRASRNVKRGKWQ